MPLIQTRRSLLSTFSLAAAASVLHAPQALAAEEPLETTTVRIATNPGICIAPQLVAEELLRDEGFTDIRYIDVGETRDLVVKVGRGEADFTADFATRIIQAINDGGAITVLGGVHVGCAELFANEGIRGISDLKGKNVGVNVLGSTPHILLTVMAAHVGLDPVNDIHWITSSPLKPVELFAAGKIDAFLGAPPDPQDLRARNIGHVIVNSAIDRPWSQYFCCMLTGNRNYVHAHPVATKRVMRAIFKTADLCVTEPARVARKLVEGGFTPRYDYAFQALSELPYGKWRDYDPEDTIRFYALRLHEAGLIKSTPNKIIAEHTDWRFLDELKRELKA
jgi:NitT/TauT family transport system substrate-binding protein